MTSLKLIFQSSTMYLKCKYLSKAICFMALFLFYVYVKCFFIIATSSINYRLIKVYRFTSPGTKIFKLIGNALLGDALVLKFQFNNISAVTTSV